MSKLNSSLFCFSNRVKTYFFSPAPAKMENTKKTDASTQVDSNDWVIGHGEKIIAIPIVKNASKKKKTSCRTHDIINEMNSLENIVQNHFPCVVCGLILDPAVKRQHHEASKKCNPNKPNYHKTPKADNSAQLNFPCDICKRILDSAINLKQHRGSKKCTKAASSLLHKKIVPDVENATKKRKASSSTLHKKIVPAVKNASKKRKPAIKHLDTPSDDNNFSDDDDWLGEKRGCDDCPPYYD